MKSLTLLLFLFVFLPALCKAEEPKNVDSPTHATTDSTAKPAAPAAISVVSVPNTVATNVKASSSTKHDLLKVLEHIRAQPHAADLANGTFMTNLADIYTDNVETKEKVRQLMSEYDNALLEKAKKWESELKDLRAQYESSIIAELPQDKRDSAKKLLVLSRSKWDEALSRDEKNRADYLERVRSHPQPQPVQVTSKSPNATATPGTPNPNAPMAARAPSEASTWMHDQRIAGMKQDEENIKSMRELLSLDDAARFDTHNHTRSALSRIASAPIGTKYSSQSAPPTISEDKKASIPNVPKPSGADTNNKPQ